MLLTDKIRVAASEAARCALCYSPPCTSACPEGVDPARFIRALRFDNKARAASFAALGACVGCNAPCEEACVLPERPVAIEELAGLDCWGEPPCGGVSGTADLSVEFCGIKCENPFFLSSSIVAGDYEMTARAFEAGWAGAVFKTIGFIVPQEVSPRFDAMGKEATPFVGFRNMEQISDHSLEENLHFLHDLKRDFPTKIIIASIMGQTDEEWTELARLCTEAGVDIIECNFSCPHMSAHGLGSDVGQSPELVKRFTEFTRKGTNLPILAKMTPNLANMELPAAAAIEGGADGIAAINTIKSITNIEPETLSAAANINGLSAVSGYSGKAVKPIALRFIRDVAIYPKTAGKPISGMGGIETWRDALEFIALGCSTVQVTTAVMQYGYRIIDDLIEGMRSYMTGRGIKSVSEIIGGALPKIVSADELDRSTVVFPRFESERCKGCGRCFIACSDAGHKAITFTSERKPKLDGKKCVGCHLCKLVCPFGAISVSKRTQKLH